MIGKRVPLQPKNINRIEQKSPTKSIKLNRKVDHHHQRYQDNNNVNILKVVSTVNSRTTIDIRQFAFKTTNLDLELCIYILYC